jgi:hypothetical protein
MYALTPKCSVYKPSVVCIMHADTAHHRLFANDHFCVPDFGCTPNYMFGLTHAYLEVDWCGIDSKLMRVDKNS